MTECIYILNKFVEMLHQMVDTPCAILNIQIFEVS